MICLWLISNTMPVDVLAMHVASSSAAWCDCTNLHRQFCTLHGKRGNRTYRVVLLYHSQYSPKYRQKTSHSLAMKISYEISFVSYKSGLHSSLFTLLLCSVFCSMWHYIIMATNCTRFSPKYRDHCWFMMSVWMECWPSFLPTMDLLKL